MGIKHHYLKCETEYFQAIEDGSKTFELRKNDRDYKLHDVLHLKETVKEIYTGREIGHLKVIYIVHGGKLGLDKDYCIMGFEKWI